MDSKHSEIQQHVRSRISYLKGFDQKIVGLRHEAERLGQMASNPKKHFSRSNLGGLYRIVNNILAADATHRIDAIEAWAQRTNGRLVEMGKRGEKPSTTDLEWLLGAIADLAALRQKALKELGDLAKKGDAMGDDPHDGAGSPDERGKESSDAGAEKSNDGAISDNERHDGAEEALDKAASDKAGDDSFRDSTNTIPLAIDDLSVVPPDDELPDHTSTIPLAIEDLRSVSSPPEERHQEPPPPPVRERHREPPPPPVKERHQEPPPVKRSSRQPAPGNVWRTVAIAAIIGFTLMTVFYLYTTKRPTDLTAPGSAGPSAPPPSALPDPVKADTPPAIDERAVEAPAPEDKPKPTSDTVEAQNKGTEKSAPHEEKAGKEVIPQAEKKNPEASKPKKARDASYESGTAVKKPETAGKEAAAPKKTPAQAQEETGMLVVQAPADKGASVIVLVDGLSKGKAPIKVKLSPGIHEVVFSVDGKTDLRVVPIRAGATKTIEAKVP